MVFFKVKDDDFYRMLKESAQLVSISANLLQSAVADPSTFTDKMSELQEIEHQADDVTQAIITKLHKTLVTPMDREDIYSLATILDDIVDFVQGAMERMVMYKAMNPFHGVYELIRLLNDCAGMIKISVDSLSNINGNLNTIIENTTQISCLESEGDRLYRLEVAKLFEEETNPIEIIKWKEILEHLEDTLDKCEDLSNTLKGVVLKYA